MELIATARFKKAMDRATAASDYTRRITSVVSDLAKAGLEVSHPLLEPREETKAATLLVLTCLLYTSPSPRDLSTSRMPSSA